ncbi:MAG TPA: phosphodiester glycosidase family protein [Candidatus Ozemobacteraceae bacterium]|nr:phosphodiester glycosidase family protein [Candidatus Ozemobacteraceae bacterium]
MSATSPFFFEILENAELLLVKKKSQPGDVTSEQLFEAEIFLAQLKRLFEQKPKEHPAALAEKLHKENKAVFDAAHTNAKAQAEKFAIVQSMSDKEKKAHLADVSARLHKEAQNFADQWLFNLSLVVTHQTTPPLDSGAPVDDDIEKTLKELRRLGYIAEAVDKIDILLCKKGLSGRKADKELDAIPIGDQYDVVVNGTFFTGTKPLGAIIINGEFEHAPKLEKIKKRGALAVMADGSYAIAQTEDETREGVTANFKTPGKPKNKVKNLMSGGVLIISSGEGLSGGNILREQRFDQPRAGLNGKISSAWDSEQLRATDHTVFALRKGQLYVIVTPRAAKQTNQKQVNETSGLQIQKNLLKLGFDAAVIFDGGSRCYLNSKNRQLKYENDVKKVSEIPCGFGIKIRKQQGSK